jgi:hypothetical protein
MELFNGEYVDYLDVVTELVKQKKITSETAFYFYEHCEETAVFEKCSNLDEVIVKIISEYDIQGKDWFDS